MRTNKYIEYAKLEMKNDKYVRFNAMSYCYGNVLIFLAKDVPKDLSVGDVCELHYHYKSDIAFLDKCKVVNMIPVSRYVREKEVE